MAGTDAIYDALFRKYQVYRADTLEELFDFAKALAYLPKPKGRRLMITTSSGGAAILAIDEAEKQGSGPGAQPHPERAAAGDAAGPLRRGQPRRPHRGRHQRPGIYRQVMDQTRDDYDTQVVIFGDPIPGAAARSRPAPPELVIFLGGAEVEREERPDCMRRASRYSPPRSAASGPWPNSSG